MEMAKTPEKRVEQFIRSGQQAKAAALLCRLALSSAQKGDITKSEGFRDRLYELDGISLSHIVQVNEAIEAQKSKFLTPDYRCRWAPLFENLSDEEANAFFYALKTLDIESEQVILEQGQPNDKLFLIHQGTLKLVYADQDKDLLIGTLGPCDIFGQETFFSVNVGTFTVKTLSPVRLSFMSRATLESLKRKGNFSEASLKNACSTLPALAERLQKKGLDRRSHKRFKLKGELSFRILSASKKQNPGRVIRADLWDISKSGLCFYYTSKNSESARRLIGHTLGVKFNVPVNGQQKTIKVTGVVQGVANHPLDEYSVHFKLNRQFSDAAIKAIQRAAFSQ